MFQGKTDTAKIQDRWVERAKAIGFTLIFIIYNHWKSQWVSDEFDYFILFGIFIFFVLNTKTAYFIWMVLGLVAMTIWYRYLELFIMILALLLFKLLKTRSKEKYDKELEWMIASSFVGKFASGKIAISEFDILFNILTIGIVVVSEAQWINLKWIEGFLGFKFTYGY